MTSSLFVFAVVVSVVSVARLASSITPNTECFDLARNKICRESFEQDLYFCLNNSWVVYDHVSLSPI